MNFSILTLGFLLSCLNVMRMTEAQTTISLGDFIELYDSLRHCEGGAGKEIAAFGRCTNALVASGPEFSPSALWTSLCSNSQAYLDCWKPIVTKSRACNAGTSRGTPSVYVGSMEAVCENDNGSSNGAALVRALNEISTQECSASGEHWVEACKAFANDMSSTNTCTRHTGLSKCLGTIVCKEQPAGKLLLDLYAKAGEKLDC